MCLNEGFFCFKYLFVLGVFIAFLFAPNQSFLDYAQASKYISIAFMVIQVPNRSKVVYHPHRSVLFSRNKTCKQI